MVFLHRVWSLFYGFTLMSMSLCFGHLKGFSGFVLMRCDAWKSRQLTNEENRKLISYMLVKSLEIFHLARLE